METPKIFISHAHRDRTACDTLLDFLGWTRHSGEAEVFDDKQLKPGSNWDAEIKAKLVGADIVVCLVSPAFVGSKYCTLVEMREAMSGSATVIPVLLRTVDFEALPLSERQALPKDKNQQLKAINLWRGEAQRDIAWTQVAKAVREALTNDLEEALANFVHNQPPKLNNLPRRNSDMTGRVADVAKLEAALLAGGTASICALGGMGGVGKTTLAVEVAHRMGKAAFPDGIWMLDMRGLDDPPREASDAMTELLLAFQSGRQLPEDPSGLYRAELAGRKMLLILDNARDADQVRPLLPPEPVAVMVTSRRRVDLGGELVDLDVLPRDEAVELLRKELRGQKVGGRAVSDAELGELARLCGDLPLAISVVAAALRGKKLATAEKFIEELGKSRGEGLARALEVLGRSLELLAAEDADLHARFLALSIMKASFTVDAAAALWACEAGEAQAALEGLCERSLLQLASGAAEGDGPPRLVMHDLLREAAEKRLGEEAESEARLLHARFFYHLLTRCDDLYLEGGEKVLEGLGLFDRERAHIEAGQAFVAGLAKAGDKGEAARLAADYPSVGGYIINIRLHSREWIAWLEVAVTAARAVGDKRAEGNALGNLGLAWADLGEPRKAIDYHEQDLAIRHEIGDRRGEGNALGNLGNAWADLGEPRKSIEYMEQVLAVMREIGDRRGEGNALGNLGIAWKNLGEPRKAIDYYEQHLTVTREIGDRRGEGNALMNTGNAWAALGEPRKAIDYYEQALAVSREIGDRRGEGNALWNAVSQHEKLAEPDTALEKAKAAWVIFRQIEDPNLRIPDKWLRDGGIDPDTIQTS